jgi:hypothetical protein
MSLSNAQAIIDEQIALIDTLITDAHSRRDEILRRIEAHRLGFQEALTAVTNQANRTFVDLQTEVREHAAMVIEELQKHRGESAPPPRLPQIDLERELR